MTDRETLMALDEIIMDEIMAQTDEEALAAISSTDLVHAEELIAAARAAHGQLRMKRAKAAVEADKARVRTSATAPSRVAPLITKAARSGSADDQADQASFDEDMAELEADEDRDEE